MTKNLHVIIPAAGASSRFYAAGYRTHKPFLTINYEGKTGYMLDHVLNTLKISYNIPIHIGIPPGYEFPYSHVIADTQSHVDTASQLLELVPDNDAVIFADCDVLISSMDFVNVCVALSAVWRPTVLVSNKINIPDRLSHIDSFPDFNHCDGMLSPYALWSLRGYPNAGILKKWIKGSPETSMDRYLGVDYDHLPSFAVEAVDTPIDWGTPEALLATGAKIVV